MAYSIIPKGSFAMGQEGIQCDVSEFAMSQATISVAEFEQFVKATGYVTQAEKKGGSSVFVPSVAKDGAWWRFVAGINWKKPYSLTDCTADFLEYPVVHVTYYDALAYCQWVNGRLPNEVEWEYAARGGKENLAFPWGDELYPNGQAMCNVWQGEFPLVNTAEDGYVMSAPCYSYEPNGYGLYQMIGNVWEWCQHKAHLPLDFLKKNEKILSQTAVLGTDEVALRGGSHLCHGSYCARYRVYSRNGALPIVSTSHIGFRCIKK